MTRWHADTLKNKVSFVESVLENFCFWACHTCQRVIFFLQPKTGMSAKHIWEIINLSYVCRLPYGSSSYNIKAHTSTYNQKHTWAEINSSWLPYGSSSYNIKAHTSTYISSYKSVVFLFLSNWKPPRYLTCFLILAIIKFNVIFLLELINHFRNIF